jgi:hypothetical protein
MTKTEADTIRKLLRYDPETGHLWRINGTKGAPRGRPAGNLNKRGYVCVRVRYKLYQGHRLAWLLGHGEWPKQDIDHINCNPADNRLCNLRLAAPHQNSANQGLSRHNTTGFKGIRFSKGSWVANLRYRGVTHRSGRHKTKEDAARAYDAMALEYCGEFARLNFPEEHKYERAA